MTVSRPVIQFMVDIAYDIPFKPLPHRANQHQTNVPTLLATKAAVNMSRPPAGATGIGVLNLIPAIVKVQATLVSGCLISSLLLGGYVISGISSDAKTPLRP